MTAAPKFYRYDNDGYFHSVITASRDPLESKIAGHDVYITPNSSTSVEPAKKEGYWAHWNGEAWDYVALPKNAMSSLRSEKSNMTRPSRSGRK